MWPMLERVGNPHQKLRVIHVAGTSGKTSTCYYLSSLLHASGKKVGMSVSPHILTVNERVQINTVPLDDAQFCHYLEKFDNLLGEYAKSQSYFEYMIMFALWVFVREKVDYVVLETGLGGLLDSTNVVTRSDKVCVLTDIGYDHQHILGNTIEEIAAQKAGIIHQGNHVLSYEQSKPIMTVIKNQMVLKNATFQSVAQKNGVKYEGLPEFQNRNYTLARAAAEYVAKRDGFKITQPNPSHVVVPGRMQKLRINNKEIIVDGAHNPQKMNAFVGSVQALYPGQKFEVVLAMRAAKDYRKTIIELKPIASVIICSEPSSVESVSANDLAEVCDELGIECTIEPNLLSAVKRGKGVVVIVTGSLYLLKMLSSD